MATTGWSVEITHLKAEIVSVHFDFVSCRKTKQCGHVLFLVHMNKVLRKMYDGSFVHCIYIYMHQLIAGAVLEELLHMCKMCESAKIKNVHP